MDEGAYIPGICNIGIAELQRRKSKLKLSAFLLILSSILFLFLPFTSLLFSFIAILACYSFILIFQIQQKFCIVFGWLSVFNFNEITSKKSKVEKAQWIELDKKRALKILALSFFSTLLFMCFIFLLKKVV